MPPVTETRAVDGDRARELADYFLANEVGNLLMTGAPIYEEHDLPRWVMPIILANAVRGVLGVVGSIAVDATSGEVLLGAAERTKVKENARRLARHLELLAVPPSLLHPLKPAQAGFAWDSREFTRRHAAIVR